MNSFDPESMPFGAFGTNQMTAAPETQQGFQTHRTTPLENHRLYQDSNTLTTATSTLAAAQVNANHTLDQSTAYQTLRPLIQALHWEVSCEFWEAVQTAPHLIMTESDPRKFLECEQRDPSKAALRLVMYWKNRKEVFEERAFLPMHHTGLGTLDDSDIELLHTGAIALLGTTDAAGRSILACDISRYLPEHSYPWYRDARARLAYYMASVACENPKAQSEGLVVLVMISSTAINEGVAKLMMRGFDLLPIKNVKMHLICLPSKTIGLSFVDKMTHYTLHMIGHFANWSSVHRGQTDEQVLQSLTQALGITQDDLPAWFGGNWAFETFERWRLRRLRTEENRVMDSTQKEERRRKLVASRSQTKRDRKNQTMLTAQKEIADLEAKNASLIDSNEALASALEFARGEVDNFTSNGYSNTFQNVFNVPASQVRLAPAPLAIFSPPDSLFASTGVNDTKWQRMATSFFAQPPLHCTQQISIGSSDEIGHDDVVDDGRSNEKAMAVSTSFY
jgi:hypothetical protein